MIFGENPSEWWGYNPSSWATPLDKLPDPASGHGSAPSSSLTGKDEANDARLKRLTQTYSALNEINQAIIRMGDEAELFPLVCRIAVNYGGVRMAWIGRPDAGRSEVVPIQSFGTGTDYLQHIRIPFREDTDEKPGTGGDDPAAEQGRHH